MCKSHDFKVGIDLHELEKMIPMLSNLCRVDPRGGIFSQPMLSAAISSALQQSLEFEFLCNHLQKPRAEVEELFAYKLRVMLAHVRVVFDTSVHNGHQLEVLLRLLKEEPAEPSEQSDLKRHKFPIHTFKNS